MLTPVQRAKRALRKEIQVRLQALMPERIRAQSHQACDLLEHQRVWQAARSVLFYAPMPGELDIWRLVVTALDAGKTAALPRFNEGRYVACSVRNLIEDVARGHFGIREPAETCAEVPLNRLDLVLVPGIAFDLQGRRLGRGKGHYDRILAAVRGKTCGVAFDQQVVAEVPVEPHDVGLNCILTPTRWIEL